MDVTWDWIRWGLWTSSCHFWNLKRHSRNLEGGDINLKYKRLLTWKWMMHFLYLTISWYVMKVISPSSTNYLAVTSVIKSMDESMYFYIIIMKKFDGRVLILMTTVRKVTACSYKLIIQKLRNTLEQTMINPFRHQF